MMKPTAFKTMCKALALAAGLALGQLVYLLYLIGVSATGFLFGVSASFLVFALVVFGAVVMYLE
jgi:hypothetical protein